MRVFDTFIDNQEEALHKNGHQDWYRLVLHDFNDGKQFEGLIHKCETWSELSEILDLPFRGIRGEGDIEKIEHVQHAGQRKKSAMPASQ